MYIPLAALLLAQGPLDQWHACRLAELSKRRLTPPWPIREFFSVAIFQLFLSGYSARWQQSKVKITAIPVSACGRTPCRRGRLLGHRGTRSRCCRRSSSRSRPSCLRAPPHHRTPGPSWALTRGQLERRRRRPRHRHRPLAQGWRPSLGRELGRCHRRPPTPHQGWATLEPNNGRVLERARPQALTPYHHRLGRLLERARHRALTPYHLRPHMTRQLRNPPSMDEVA